MFKRILKDIVVTELAPRAIAITTLLAIGYVAHRSDLNRMIKDAEHYANCPENHR